MKKTMFWAEKLGISHLKESKTVTFRFREYIYKNNILREKSAFSYNQTQTKDAFAFKWKQEDSYNSKASDDFKRKWMVTKYLGGNRALLKKWLFPGAKFLDAGCGTGLSTLLLFGKKLKEVHYLGVDISDAVELAMRNFRKKKIIAEFLQADLLHLPFSKPTFDIVFSEGVLHHTDNPQKTFNFLVKLIKPGGRFIFYVYRKKSAIREFADDYIRDYLKGFDDKSAWEQLIPLTKLGKVLGDLKVTINVPQDIPFLGIPSGKIDLQRFIYWYIFKVFYKRDFSIKEMNHINFDWYRPMNCHRYTGPEIEKWCIDNNLDIDRFFEEEAGISVVGVKKYKKL